jgi:hypothetical protein
MSCIHSSNTLLCTRLPTTTNTPNFNSPSTYTQKLRVFRSLKSRKTRTTFGKRKNLPIVAEKEAEQGKVWGRGKASVGEGWRQGGPRRMNKTVRGKEEDLQYCHSIFCSTSFEYMITCIAIYSILPVYGDCLVLALITIFLY